MLNNKSAKFPRRRSRGGLTGRYLEHKTKVCVRFHEVDGLHVVWHGHYIKYFEDARVAFGKAYKIDYQDIYNAGMLAPVVSIRCDYIASATYNDELEVTARLFERESAKIEYEFEIHRIANNTLIAVGQSVQVFMTLEREMILTLPSLMRDFYDKHRDNMLQV